MKEGKKSFFSKLVGYTFLLLNIGAVIWLVLCAFAANTSPAEVRNIALFGFTTPFAILANVLCALFWLFSKKKIRSLLSITVLIGCYKVALTIFGLNFFSGQDMSRAANHVKIITWNAHGMGIFNVPHSKVFDERLMSFIKDQNADILVIPEFSAPKSDITKPFASKIIKNCGYVEYRFKPDNTLGTTIFLGTAVFSKYPFKNFVAHKLSEEAYLLQGDMQLPSGKMMRMFFVHLSTFGLSDYDKKFIENVKQNNTSMDDDKGHSRTFIWKFNNAFRQRAKEVNKIAAIMAQSPYPTFICGDFNDLPGSYTYSKLRGDLNDAFIDKGVGLGRTYNEIIPTLRIDHMFYNPEVMKAIGYECEFTSLSDHNPVIVNFEIIP
ncbi:MAG: endonuclease/exonuclease/phosphatase family protein [Bacteroidetes bacterium]|nr:endonuclease/exonuclease/phosphatase family protein [Bacteroidota bacterium]